jgi:hypothetical protein
MLGDNLGIATLQAGTTIEALIAFSGGVRSLGVVAPFSIPPGHAGTE